MSKFISIFGWYGTAAILLAYALNSFSLMESGSILYQFLNITGGIGLTFASLSKGAYQAGVLNATWAVVGIIAIIKGLF